MQENGFCCISATEDDDEQVYHKKKTTYFRVKHKKIFVSIICIKKNQSLEENDMF